MGSLHDEIYAASAVPLETDFFGEALTLIPPEGASVALTAVIVRDAESIEALPDGRRVARVAEIRIPATALATTSDKHRATFDGCDWDLRPLNSVASDGWWRFQATRGEFTERARPGYRGTRTR